MTWIVSAILIVVAFVIGWLIAPKTVRIEIVNTPKIDTSKRPLRSHNPDNESFGQAQEREYD